MKKYFFGFILIFLLSDCKKDQTEEQIVDMSSLFDNTIWSGRLQYSNKNYFDPYTIAFHSGGTLHWTQFSGEYAGTYTIDNRKKEITINFGQGNSFTATIVNNKEFSNIRYNNASGWTILDGEWNKTADQSLDNTSWAYGGITILFQPASKVVFKAIGSTREATYIKSRGTFKFILDGKFYYGYASSDRIVGLEVRIANFYQWMPTRQ